MHGNLYSLRVDYTLDALPAESDRWRFLEYLLSPKERLELGKGVRRGSLTSGRTEHGDQLPCRRDVATERFEHGSHLLVMGVAASERRTRAFIEHACRHLKKGFHVFWLCYTPKDLVEVTKFAQELALEPDTFQILRHPDYGLLFTELYQTIRRGIPTSGIIYPFASRLSMPPMPRVAGPGGPNVSREAREDGEAYSNAIKERLDRIQARGFQYHKLIVATSEAQETRGQPVERGGSTAPASTGITTACARVFEQIRVEQVAIWLDMNDVSSTDDLFEQLLDAANHRSGQSSPLPVYVRKHPEVQAKEIVDLVNKTNTKWVFFLNARETPGTNLIDEREPSMDQSQLRPNNWLDDLASEGGGTRTDDESNTCPRFLKFIAALCAPNSPLISIILLCRQRSATKESVLIQQIRAEGLETSLVKLARDCAEAREVESVIGVLRWASEQIEGRDDKKQRRKFLQALISLQRTRYLATIWSEACGGASSQPGVHGEDVATRWLEELEVLGLVRRKPGGFIWIHSRTRTILRRALFRPSDFQTEHLEGRSKSIAAWDFQAIIEEWKPEREAPGIHWELAHWYRRILAASRFPGAVFEAVYHAIRSAEELILSAIRPDLSARRPGMLKVACDRIDWASSLLHAHAFLVQTQGYSRGSCRRLLDLRRERCQRIDDAIHPALTLEPKSVAIARTVKAATRRLRIRCTEAMRSIAREVGEDRLAYNRQQELRALLSWDGWDVKLYPWDVKDYPKGELTDKWLRVLASQEHWVGQASASPNHEPALGEQATDRGESWLEWMRWWRWNGMLGMASRSYVAARRSFLRAALSITDETPGKDRTIVNQWAAIGNHLNDYARRAADETSDAPEPSHRILELFQSLAAACEGRAQILGRVVEQQQRLRIEAARLLEQVVSLEMQELGLIARLRLDLRLLRWGDGSGVPNLTNNLVIVGIDNNSLLHIRTFDAGGDRVSDEDESTLPSTQNTAILAFKRQILGCLPPHILTGAEKTQLINEATSIVNQTRVRKIDLSVLQRRYQRIIDWVQVAKRVVEAIRCNDQSPDSHDTILALWCQSRLLMHEGLCRGRLGSPCEAMVLLADSEAVLNLYDPRRLNADLAIIELHRAEVKLTEASQIRLPWFFNGPIDAAFHELDACFDGDRFDSAAWRNESKKLRNQFEVHASGRELPLRRARSLVQDAFSYLNRADRILSLRRRNVGWMTWFFQRKLSAIAMSVWATVLEKGTPIPFLGLEAAPRGCPTIADRILSDSQRMIRIDAYRLATILDAYIGCVKGFFMRLYLEIPCDTLTERQEDMIDRVKSAAWRLQETLDERKKSNTSNLSEPSDIEVAQRKMQDDSLDVRIQRYVEQTLDRAGKVINQLGRPLR